MFSVIISKFSCSTTWWLIPLSVYFRKFRYNCWGKKKGKMDTWAIRYRTGMSSRSWQEADVWLPMGDNRFGPWCHPAAENPSSLLSDWHNSLTVTDRQETPTDQEEETDIGLSNVDINYSGHTDCSTVCICQNQNTTDRKTGNINVKNFSVQDRKSSLGNSKNPGSRSGFFPALKRKPDRINIQLPPLQTH